MDDKLFNKLIKLYFEAKCFEIYHSPGQAAPALDELNREVAALRAEFDAGAGVIIPGEAETWPDPPALDKDALPKYAPPKKGTQTWKARIV